MERESNSSDVFFERFFPKTFEPHFFKWKSKFGSIAECQGIDADFYGDYSEPEDEADLTFKYLTKRTQIYQNPIVENSFVVYQNDEVRFLHKTGNIDVPSIHRFMAPAIYSIDGSEINRLRWFIHNSELSEFDFWMTMCKMFCDKLQMCLSGDESCYYIENDRYDLPFPERLNLPIKDPLHTEDEMRTDLNAHAVWNLGQERYVDSERFWAHWEKRGFNLKVLF